MINKILKFYILRQKGGEPGNF